VAGEGHSPRVDLVDIRDLSPHRHCERSEAIQSPSADQFWIASLRSQWRGGSLPP